MLWPRCLPVICLRLFCWCCRWECATRRARSQSRKLSIQPGKLPYTTPPRQPIPEPGAAKLSPPPTRRKKAPEAEATGAKPVGVPAGNRRSTQQRTRDIQEALIREHYLDGKPSGKWDEASQKAMRRYQSDNGWQSVTTPDSRALIKLGLGPDHAHLLNPDSAMTSSLAPAHAEEQTQKAAAVAVPSIDGTGPSSNEKPTVVGDPVPVNGPPRQ